MFLLNQIWKISIDALLEIQLHLFCVCFFLSICKYFVIVIFWLWRHQNRDIVRYVNNQKHILHGIKRFSRLIILCYSFHSYIFKINNKTFIIVFHSALWSFCLQIFRVKLIIARTCWPSKWIGVGLSPFRPLPVKNLLQMFLND